MFTTLAPEAVTALNYWLGHGPDNLGNIIIIFEWMVSL